MQANCLAEKMKALTTEQILSVWEWTGKAENDVVCIIRAAVMDELEHRNPAGFYAWLDEEASKDNDLRKYIMEESK